jgi:3-methyladenine DNA glycosylase AlkD
MLEALSDPSYAEGSRRTVPSLLPSHAVRVPEIRRVAGEWRRAHNQLSADEALSVAEALWATTWREERIVAMQIVAGSKALVASLPWEVIERWSGQIDNWEHVDHLASEVTGPILVGRPQLIEDVERLAGSEQSWQRRLAVVTLIVASRRDAGWAPRLAAMVGRLQGDRGPTMRKAIDWGRKTLREVEGKVG